MANHIQGLVKNCQETIQGAITTDLKVQIRGRGDFLVKLATATYYLYLLLLSCRTKEFGIFGKSGESGKTSASFPFQAESQVTSSHLGSYIEHKCIPVLEDQ